MAWSIGGGASLRTLALGQVISLLIAGTGVTSTYLAEAGINIPTTQSLLNYVLLCSYALWRLAREGTKPLRTHPMRYFLLALADVEANAIIVEAYQHTTITSVMLLDCATIPVCMLLSYRFLNSRFTRQHYIGVSLCLLGIVVLALSDTSGSDNGEARPRALYGDALCLLAATLYAISNVGQEACLRLGPEARVEFLGALGLFGSVIAGVQVAVFESSAIQAIQWTGQSRLAFAGFAACLFTMYSLTSIFLSAEPAAESSAPAHATEASGLAARDGLAVADGAEDTTRPAEATVRQTSTPASSPAISRATLFNLSLLTSDLWAIIAGVALFGQSLGPLYFLALALVATGLLIYHRAGDKQAQEGTESNTTSSSSGPDPRGAVVLWAASG